MEGNFKFITLLILISFVDVSNAQLFGKQARIDDLENKYGLLQDKANELQGEYSKGYHKGFADAQELTKQNQGVLCKIDDDIPVFTKEYGNSVRRDNISEEALAASENSAKEATLKKCEVTFENMQASIKNTDHEYSSFSNPCKRVNIKCQKLSN